MRHASVMHSLAVYDLDKTITRRATYAAWLWFWLSTEARGRILWLPLVGLTALLYLARSIDRGQLKQLNQRLLMGGLVPQTQVDAAARRFATQQLAHNIYPQALAQIAADRAEGRRVVIATASYGFYAEAIGAALGITDVIATRVQSDHGRIRARIDGENCYGPAKLRMFESWLAAQSLSGAVVRFYSDHVSDTPMFNRASEAVATNASPRLRAMAITRNWRLLDW